MNITRGLLTFSLITATVTGYCQSPGLEWVGVYDGDNTRETTQVVTDNAGNVYTVGVFFGTMDADPSGGEHLVTSQDQGDGFIIKQSSDGHFQWVVQLNGDNMQQAYTVNVDAAGNIIVSGYFEDVVDFDPGAANVEYTANGPTAFIMKLTPAGNLVWAKPFLNVDGTSSIYAVSTDASNNIFIGGSIFGTADADPNAQVFDLESAGSNDLWFTKLGPSGNFISAVITGGADDEFIETMTVDHNNELVVVGSFEGHADFDPGPGTVTLGNDGDDAFILKLSNSLGYVWVTQIIADELEPRKVATDASNNIIINGSFDATADFDTGTGEFILGGVNGDIFLASYNSSGDLNWVKQAGSLSAETSDALAVDASGNIYIAGQYSEPFDINPDSGQEIIEFKPDGFDQYIAKFSNLGALLWYKAIPSSDIISAADMHVDANNNLYVTGDWNGDVDFSFNTCLDGKLTREDNATTYLIKITQSASTSCFGFLEQPADNQSGCVLQEMNFAAPAGGTNHIQYQWQMFISGNWVDLDDQEFVDGDDAFNGYSGTHTPYLTIIPVFGGDVGEVRLMATGDNVTAIYSNTVHYIVQPIPPLPGLTATSGCGPGFYALAATGTTYGKYQWYIDEVLQPDSVENVSYFFNANTEVSVAIEENGCGGSQSLIRINTDHCSQPPGLEWVQQLGPGFIKPIAMAIDSNNDIYIAGEFTSTIDFNLGVGTFEMTPNGTEDYFVAKYRADGSFFWARQTDMPIYDISTGGADDVYYVGNFQGTIDFDPGPGTFNMTVTGTGRDMAMVELASDGTFEWAKQFVGTANESGNLIRAVTDGPSGDIIITGNFTRTVDFDPGVATANLTSASSGGSDIFVAKYDQDGNYLWAKRIGSTAFVERGEDVEVDADGYIYAVGLFQTTVDFDPNAGTFPLVSAGATDAFALCLNSDGTLRWADRVGGTGADEAIGLDLDHQDHPVVIGHFTNVVDFDPGTGTFNMTGGGSTSFVLKLTDLGAFEWAKATGGILDKVFVDPTDRVTLAGSFENRIDADPGPDEYRLETAVTADVVVSQLDGTGNFLWAYNTNASGLPYFENKPVGLVMDVSGNLFVLGEFQNTVDMDPTNCVYALSSATRSSEIFFQKIKPNLATLCFSLQPKTFKGCEGTQVHLTSEAVGTTNIAYQWQKLNTTFGYFENIIPVAGYSGITTPELVIDATSTFGSGHYRVLVTGDNASSGNSDVVQVTSSIKPDPPTFTPVSFCSPGRKELLLDGDNDGYYRWYEDMSAPPIAGAVDHDYTTPFLTGSTTYFVTALNGACESDFAQFDVPVDINIDQPIGTGASTCTNPAILTLKAESETGGEYRWYENAEDDDPVDTNTSGSFTTPSLSATTYYYVSLSDGTCESLRTEVEAHVGDLAAPDVSGATICTGNATTIEATAGSAGEVRWYTSATATSPMHTGTTFDTPVLSSSTTYYVSYFEASCESARIPVTITVNPCTANQPPAIASVSPSTTAGTVLTVTLDLSDPDDNLDLSTLKILTQPKSGATASIDQNNHLLIDYSGTTFVGQDSLVVEVCDLAGSCFQRTITVIVEGVEGDVFIYNAVSPNNDGKNDVFYLANVTQESTKNNRVRIYNRWGDVVFDVEDYDNVNIVFVGISNGGKDLQSGTYFYKVDFLDKKTSETGYLSLKR